MSAPNVGKDRRNVLLRPALPVGENERLCVTVSRGTKSLCALFLAHLDKIAPLEESLGRERGSLAVRYRSFHGFRRGVSGIKPTGSAKEFWQQVRKSVEAALIADEPAHSCDEIPSDRFKRVFMSSRGKTLKPETLHQLTGWFTESERALETLIIHNAGLVYFNIRPRRQRDHFRDELIMEGMIGLRRGILRFDNRFGCKLSTFVPYWIRQAAWRYSQNNLRLIRLPVQVLDKVRTIQRAEASCFAESGLSDCHDGSVPMEAIARRTGFSPSVIMAVLKSNERPVSFDQPFGGSAGPLSEFIAGQNEWSEESLVMKDFADKMATTMAEILTTREYHVLKERYTGDGRTLEEVGQDYGVTRERIRQIEAKAIRKLRRRLID